MRAKRAAHVWCALGFAIAGVTAVGAPPELASLRGDRLTSAIESRDNPAGDAAGVAGNPQQMFARVARNGWVVPYTDVDAYRKTLYQARGEVGLHDAVTQSRVDLVEAERDAARTEVDMDVKGPSLDANAMYERLGVVRHMHAGSSVQINPADPTMGGRHVSPNMLRSLGGRYAPAATPSMIDSGVTISGRNMSYGGSAIRSRESTYVVIHGEVPRDTIRMTPEQRREMARIGDSDILNGAAREQVEERNARLDILRELNSRRAEGEDVTFGQVVAQRRLRFEQELALQQQRQADLAAQAAAQQQAAPAMNAQARVNAAPQVAPQLQPAPAPAPGIAPALGQNAAANLDDVLQQHVTLLRRTEQRIDALQAELNELRTMRNELAAKVENLLAQREAQVRQPVSGGNLTRQQVVDITQEVMIANPDLALRAVSGDTTAQQAIWALVQRQAGTLVR